jgi:uncharacterized protein YjbI with pentapeptide repeats
MLKPDYWLHPRNRSRELLVFILGLGLAAFLLRNAQGYARMATVVVIAVLGAALALGCLIVFPRAEIWGTEEEISKGTNDVRNVLIIAVVGAFGLITLFLTYQSAEASRTSAEVAAQQATASRLSDAGSLMGHPNKGIRLAGVDTLRQLMEDDGITQQRAYRILTSYIRSESPWGGKASRDWKRMSDGARQAAASSPLIGDDSPRKRAADVQGALDLLSARSKIAMPNGDSTVDFRADLRDVNLQGAAFGTAYFENAIFNGAHLDHADFRVRDGQASADVRGADFRGASLHSAHLNGVNLQGALFQVPFNEDGTPRPQQTTDLSHVDLRRANLTDTKFQGANLRGVRLAGAVIVRTDFTKAVLTGADLKGVDLSNSVGLETADLSGILQDGMTRLPAGVSAP